MPLIHRAQNALAQIVRVSSHTPSLPYHSIVLITAVAAPENRLRFERLKRSLMTHAELSRGRLRSLWAWVHAASPFCDWPDTKRFSINRIIVR
jgi:hypothetical protein